MRTPVTRNPIIVGSRALLKATLTSTDTPIRRTSSFKRGMSVKPGASLFADVQTSLFGCALGEGRLLNECFSNRGIFPEIKPRYFLEAACLPIFFDFFIQEGIF